MGQSTPENPLASYGIATFFRGSLGTDLAIALGMKRHPIKSDLKKLSMSLALPAVLVVPALLPLGCEREERETPTATETAQVNTEIEEIDEEPQQHIGKSVKVIGEIDDVYGARAFELEGLDLIFEDEVLVLTKSPIALGQQAMAENEMVRVQGIVRKFSKQELETELGWKLEEEVSGEWEGKPVIVAQAIDAVRRYARWSETDAQQGEMVGMSAFYTATVQQRPTLENMAVTFENTLVNQARDGKLWVGWSHPGVMVVPAGGLSVEGIKKGDLVDISGRFSSVQSATQIEGINKLGRVEKAALEQDGVYIEAASIEKAEATEDAAELANTAEDTEGVPNAGATPVEAKGQQKAADQAARAKPETAQQKAKPQKSEEEEAEPQEETEADAPAAPAQPGQQG